MRILFINPVGNPNFDSGVAGVLRQVAGENTRFDVVSLRRGPSHLEYGYYEALVTPDLLHKVKEAENSGYDAVVLGCFYDIALQEAREVSERTIITAPGEATMLLACSLGHKFSIIVGRRKWIPQMMGNVIRYGLRDRLASFKVLEMGVLDFQNRKDETEKRQMQVAREAIEKDEAEVLILGCTMEYGFWKKLQAEFGVPVLDPVITPFKYAEYLVDLRNRFGWSHSKIGAYESPPVGEIISWKLPEQYGTDVWYKKETIEARRRSTQRRR